MTPKEKTVFNAEEMAVMEACAADKFKAMATFLKIYDKNGELVPFSVFDTHRKYMKWRKPFSIVVKGRQIFMTSFVEADNTLDTMFRDGLNCALLNIDSDKTEEVFERVHVFVNNMPYSKDGRWTLKPKLDVERGNKLTFKRTHSSFSALTCKNDAGPKAAAEFGRSLTCQRLHVSDAGYVTHLDKILEGYLESMPVGDKTRVVLEGTGNGARGEFYGRAMMIKDNGKLVAPNVWHYGDQSLHFIAWFEHPEYRMAEDPFEITPLTSPDAIHHWAESEQEHRREMDKYPELSENDKNEALYWRRWVAINKHKLATDPIGCIRIMNQEHPATLKHAFQTTGSAYLSITKVEQQAETWKAWNTEGEYAPLPWIGRIYREKDANGHVHTRFKQETRGDIMIWFPPVRRWKHRYIVGGDIGGGLPDSNRDCAFVIDRERQVVAAAVHGTYGPKKMARLLQDLGYHYGTCLLAWENNNHGIGVTMGLREDDYPHLYSWNDKQTEDLDFGFLTNERNRKTGLELLKARYEDQIQGLQIPYLGFYPEARAFRKPPGSEKPEGIGEFDDTVMAIMIANAVSATMPPPEKIKEKYIPEPGTVGYEVAKRAKLNRQHVPAYSNY